MTGHTLNSIYTDSSITGGEKSSLNWDSNPGPLAYRASNRATELLRPDILTDSLTNRYLMTH